MKKISKVLAIVVAFSTPLVVQSNDLDSKTCSLEFPINCMDENNNTKN